MSLLLAIVNEVPEGRRKPENGRRTVRVVTSAFGSSSSVISSMMTDGFLFGSCKIQSFSVKTKSLVVELCRSPNTCNKWGFNLIRSLPLGLVCHDWRLQHSDLDVAVQVTEYFMDCTALQDRLHTIWTRLLPYALYSAWQHERPTSSSESSSESMSSSSSSLSSSLSIPNPPPSVIQNAFNSCAIQMNNLHTLHVQLGGTAHNRVAKGVNYTWRW